MKPLLGPIGLLVLLLLDGITAQRQPRYGQRVPSRSVTKLRKVTLSDLINHPAYASYMKSAARKLSEQNLRHGSVAYKPTSLGLRRVSGATSQASPSQRLISAAGSKYLPALLQRYGVKSAKPGQPKEGGTIQSDYSSSSKAKALRYLAQLAKGSKYRKQQQQQRPVKRPALPPRVSTTTDRASKSKSKLLNNPIIQKYLMALAASVQAKGKGRKPVSLMQPALVNPVYGNSYIKPSGSSSVQGQFNYATAGQVNAAPQSNTYQQPAPQQSYPKPQTTAPKYTPSPVSSPRSGKKMMPVGVVYPSFNGVKPTYRLIPLFGDNPYRMFGSQTYGPLPMPAGYKSPSSQQSTSSDEGSYGMASKIQSPSSYAPITPAPYVSNYQPNYDNSYSNIQESSQGYDTNQASQGYRNNQGSQQSYESNQVYNSNQGSQQGYSGTQQSYNSRPGDESNMRSFKIDTGSSSSYGGGNIPVITISLEGFGDGYSSSASREGSSSYSSSSSLGEGFSYANSGGSDPYEDDSTTCVEPPSK